MIRRKIDVVRPEIRELESLIVTDLRFNSPSEVEPLIDRVIERSDRDEVPSHWLSAALRHLRTDDVIRAERATEADPFLYYLTEQGARRYDQIAASLGSQATPQAASLPEGIPGTI